MRSWLVGCALASVLLGCSQEPSEGASSDEASKFEGASQVSCAPSGADASTAGSESDPSEEDLVIKDIGAPCTKDAECSGGKCVVSMTLPGKTEALQFKGGYCSVWCPDDRRCGAAAACPLYPVATFLPDVSVCLQKCKTASDCRAGYACAVLPPLPGEDPSSSTFCIPPSAAN